MSAGSSFDGLRDAARRFGVRRFWRAPPAPTNWRAPDAAAAAIDVKAEYDLGVGLAYVAWLREAGASPAGLRVLEIGPGSSYGSAVTLAAFGAKVSVADRWLASWRREFDGPYYRALAGKIRKIPGADPNVAERLASDDRYTDETVTFLDCEAENLSLVEAFDATLSNAVLEHVTDPARALSALARATRPGGLAIHQVDYRDHRNFTRPLDHLLFSEKQWLELTRRVHMEYGTQRRPKDYAAAFAKAGLKIMTYVSTDHAELDYAEKIAARLARLPRSPAYRATAADLIDLGGKFVAMKPQLSE